MSDIVTSDELNALAAEYVLGTLDYEERNGASALLEVDHEFRGIVRIWERRLGELHLMVEPVEPDAKLWERIKTNAATTPQLSPPELLEIVDPPAPDAPIPATTLEVAAPSEAAASEAGAAPESVTAEPQPAAIAEAEQKLAELAALLPAAAEQIAPPSQPQQPSPTGPVDLDEVAAEQAQKTVAPPPPPPLHRRGAPAAVAPAPVRKRSRGWMATACLTGLLAIALACLIGAWRYFPDRLPQQLRAETLLNIAPSPSLPPPAPQQEQPKPKPEPPTPFDE